MIVTLYRNAWDNVPQTRDLTWDEFAASLTPREMAVQDKRALPAFSPGEMKPGTLRHHDNTARVHFGVLDLDKVNPAQIRTILDSLHGVAAVIYTSWSHATEISTTGLWRLRMCVPFTRPVEAIEWPGVWPSVLARFRAPGDPKCKDSSRMYFGAFTPPGTIQNTHYVVIPGHPLDPGSLVTTARVENPLPTTLETIPRERLQTLAKNWKRSKDENRINLGLALDRLVKGESFAEPGSRDNTLFALCRDLIRTWPNADPESLASHFAQSLQVMGPDAPALHVVLDKLQRAQASVAQETAEHEAQEALEAQARLRQAWEANAEPGRDWPYTGGEILSFQTRLRCTPEELRYRWIIQKGPVFYFLGPRGYSAPYGEKDALNGALRDLAPAVSAGVDLWQIGPTGDWMRKGLSTLMAEYGTVATDVVLDLRAQEARYDASNCTFIEAPCPIRRDLVPEFDPEVQHWVTLLAGPQAQDLTNWIALVTDLRNTCAALVLTGPGDTGKNLLVHGLARIYTLTQPTSFLQALANFNDALARCPIVFADEQMPKDWKGAGRTAEIREFIGTMARPFKRKYAPDSVILGAPRLVVASNNEEVLAFNEALTPDDVDALGGRFFHVPIPNWETEQGQKVCPARDYLRTVDAKSFVEKDRIAKHALWLTQNYPIRREGRFMIRTATQQDTIRALSIRGGLRSALCQWLVGYLRNPGRVDSTGAYLVRIKDGRLLVNAQGILENWVTYVESEAVPTMGRLAQAIANLATGRRFHIANPRGGSTHYRAIDPEHLFAWARMTEFASREEIQTSLAIDTEKRPIGGAGIKLAPSPRPN